jgi:hypothetical protein
MLIYFEIEKKEHLLHVVMKWIIRQKGCLDYRLLKTTNWKPYNSLKDGMETSLTF